MVKAKSQKESYCTEISDGNTTIIADVTKEKGGTGEYFRPHDLICAGLAACLNITARMILDREKVNYKEVIIDVNLDKSDENKTKFIYDVDIIGDVSPEVKQRIIKMLENCPVRKTLSKEAEFLVKSVSE